MPWLKATNPPGGCANPKIISADMSAGASSGLRIRYTLIFNRQLLEASPRSDNLRTENLSSVHRQENRQQIQY